MFNERILKRLKGSAAIGHTRYSTQGGDRKKNIQPLTAGLSKGPLALAHNGNIVNFSKLKKDLMNQGSIFYSSSDTECIIHLLAQENNSPVEKALSKCLSLLEGAYSLVFLTKDSMITARDPMGFRPLVLGQRKWKGSDGKEQKSWVIASETCAFDLIGAELVREIEPGEIWIIDKNNNESSLFLEKQKKLSLCVFEHVYFARPDSQVFGKNVYQSRKEMGRILAKEKKVEADLVIPVPDSGVPAAIGYSETSGIPYEMGIVRNHYIGRTFIHPSQSIRDFKVKIKLSPQRKLINGKKVVVVDDSLVRGTTSKSVVQMIRQAGAKEIHFRVSSPPITGPCFYGVDTPEKSELIAASKSVQEIKDYLQVESLAFLSHEGLMEAVRKSPVSSVEKNKAASAQRKEAENTFCSACFTGNYPTAIYT